MLVSAGLDSCHSGSCMRTCEECRDDEVAGVSWRLAENSQTSHDEVLLLTSSRSAMRNHVERLLLWCFVTRVEVAEVF